MAIKLVKRFIKLCSLCLTEYNKVQNVHSIHYFDKHDGITFLVGNECGVVNDDKVMTVF